MVRRHLRPVSLIEDELVSSRLLDSIHLAMAFASAWIYLIKNWGNDAIYDYIPWSVHICAFVCHFQSSHIVVGLSLYVNPTFDPGLASDPSANS